MYFTNNNSISINSSIFLLLNSLSLSLFLYVSICWINLKLIKFRKNSNNFTLKGQRAFHLCALYNYT